MARTSEELRVAIENIRNLNTYRMLNTPVGKLQDETKADREAKGSSWVSRATLPAPLENDARQIIIDAVESLGIGNEHYKLPATSDVRLQWTGFRAGVEEMEPEPNASEEEKFLCLNKEVRSPTTVLYAHGGGNYILGPAARRATTTKLAQLTGGKCLTLQHRLAPQHPFPAALLDFLVGYLSLLHPPHGSIHTPIQAQHIVFAGDSSGAELALAMVQVILAARKKQGTDTPTLRFHGNMVELPMPAGLAVQSPSTDNQHDTMPSWAANVEYDIVPAELPGLEADFPSDEVWPSNPPRGNYYCEASMVCHPLVSPMVAKSWKGCPPIYMAMGSKERIVDGGKVVAQLAARQNVPVIWDEYELMPHNWPMLFRDHPNSIKCYRSWAKACSRFVEGPPVETMGILTELESLHTRNLDVKNLTQYTKDEIESWMRDRQKTVRIFTGGKTVKSML